MAESISFYMGSLPPSLNKLYFHKGNRRILSSEGKKWKNEFIHKRGGAELIDLIKFSPLPEDQLSLNLFFFFTKDKLFNKGWGKDKRCKSPFKNVDVTNLVKLTEDAISELVGISDRANFEVHIYKRVAPENDGFVMATLSIKPMKEGEEYE